MSSFIFHFRPWLVAFILLVAFETTLYCLAGPSEFDRTNFLQFSFARDETPQRLFVLDKIRAFADSKPKIVQSGDSSGFYGIEPSVVMKHLPKDNTYLNMSCCANLGFSGYYNVLDLMAQRNASVRYMVLHFTPYTMPRPELWDSDGAALWGIPDIKVFGGAVYQEFLSAWRLFHLPSLAYRKQVTDRVFYARGLFNRLDRPLLNNVNYLEFLRVFQKNLGWMPETDQRIGVSEGECVIPTPEFFSFKALRSKTYLEEILESFRDLAKRHGATLVVVFQPVGCSFGTGAGSAKSRLVIDKFKVENPDVEFPFPLIETWPVEMFSVAAHVRQEDTDKLGDRLGTAMSEIIVRHERPALDRSN
jgi:hypothetical protein